MRIAVVTGSREHAEHASLCEALSGFRPHVVLHGGATGADAIADAWARHNGVQRGVFPCSPDRWERAGKKAGPMRNEVLAEVAASMRDRGHDVRVFGAMPGGPGTHDMIRRCRAKGFDPALCAT